MSSSKETTNTTSSNGSDGVYPTTEMKTTLQNIEQHETTKFVDDTLSKSLVDNRGYTKNDIFDTPLRVDDESVISFLRRPIVVAADKFRTTDARGATIASYNIGNLLTSTDIWAKKLYGYRFITGNFYFKLQVNAQPFQAGMYLLHHMPMAKIQTLIGTTIPSTHSLWCNFNIATKYQQPCSELDIRDTSCTLMCPYISPAQAFDLTAPEEFDWGNIYISCVSPVRDSTSSTVEYTLWAWMDEVQVSGNIYPESAVGGRRSRRRNVKKLSTQQDAEKNAANGGVISTIAGGVSTVAKGIGAGIPALGPIAQPVSWVADAIRGAAKYFGYSKPVTDTGVSFFIERPQRHFVNAHGTFPAESLGLMSDNRVSLHDMFARSEHDEMSFEYLKNIETPSHFFNWSVLDGRNTVLHSHAVGPLSTGFVYAATGGTTIVYPPIYHVGRHFAAYRGSMVMRLKVVKTKFHAGRLAVEFIPYNTFPGGQRTTPLDENDSSYVLREIIDLVDSDEITLELPFIANTPFLAMGEPFGFITIRVINELRSAGTVASDVECIMFFSGGDDLTFTGLLDYAPKQEVIVPQSAGTEAHGHMPIGSYGVQSPKIGLSSYTTGEICLSIKTMLMRYYRWSTVTSTNCVQFCPRVCSLRRNAGGTIVQGSTTRPLFTSIFDELGSAYLLHRGTINIAVKGECAVFLSSSCALDGTVPMVMVPNNNVPPVYSAESPVLAYPYIPSVDGNAGALMHYQFPQYSVCLSERPFVPRYASPGFEYTSYFEPSADLARLSIVAGGYDCQIFRAAGDDYQMGAFVGFCPVFIPDS